MSQKINDNKFGENSVNSTCEKNDLGKIIKYKKELELKGQRSLSKARYLIMEESKVISKILFLSNLKNKQNQNKLQKKLIDQQREHELLKENERLIITRTKIEAQRAQSELKKGEMHKALRERRDYSNLQATQIKNLAISTRKNIDNQISYKAKSIKQNEKMIHDTIEKKYKRKLENIKLKLTKDWKKIACQIEILEKEISPKDPGLNQNLNSLLEEKLIERIKQVIN